MNKFLGLLALCIIVTAPLVTFAQQNEVTPPVTPTAFTSCNPDGTEEEKETCYRLLEELPQSEGDAITGIDVGATGSDKGIGGFINLIFEIGIGVAGVIAVVMLVIYGFQYAANDKSIADFSALKEKITRVILGLLLLICTVVILNTINPDLLIVEPSIQKKYLQIEEGDGGEDSISSGEVPPSSYASKVCSEGITQVQGIYICKSIADNLNRLLTDARAAGANLTGSGYRSSQSQISLRIKHCGGNSQYNIYDKPARQCVPPTAQPGASRHEAGLAVDFKCNGVTLRKSSNCYTWMQNNAKKYGFYNFPKESWHWSIDGK